MSKRKPIHLKIQENTFWQMVSNLETWLLTEDLNLFMSLYGKKASQPQVF